MASTTLYPPIVDSYTPAFIASGDAAYCRLYYSLSKFSSSVDTIKSIHISIVKQSSGQSVVNRKDGNERFRSTGILVLNTKPIAVEGQENLYYTDILNEDIKNGWTIGWMYKIQVRFGTVAYTDNTIGLATWLNLNSNNLSEWSTYTITKAIDKPVITIPNFKYNSSLVGNNANKSEIYSVFTSTLELTGSYSNTDTSEILYAYRFKLYDADGGLLEDSDFIYANQYTPNQMYYLFNTEFENEKNYKLEFSYETLNKYIETKIFDLTALFLFADTQNVQLLSAEDEGIMLQYTSIEEEQTDGRVVLKLISDSNLPFFGNVCIRRADSKTNFLIWEDIQIFPIINQNINELPLVYDYTTESGVWYKYGIQFIDNSGFRSVLVEKDTCIKREFDYCYLLGEHNQQLCLKFDNNINNFKYNYNESKVDTIGGQYPFITRNGDMNYRSFSMSGLISFNMDDNHLFTDMLKLYQYENIANLYNAEEYSHYDYTYERDFRDKVLKFLGDGKPKLYKSPTEGNMIVRLMDINATPNQTLGRLVFSFNATAYEIAEPTLSNYLKYNFYTINNYSSELAYTETRIGQFNGTIPVNSDLFELIATKYYNPNYLGNTHEVVKIKNLTLFFPGPKLDIINNAGQLMAGHNIDINGNLISVYNKEYAFDENISFVKGDNLIIKGDSKNQVKTVDIEANFIFDIAIMPITEKKISSKSVSRNIGQFAETMYPEESVYDKTYYKYFYDWTDSFRKLYELKCVCIEASPGAMFMIKDSADTEGMVHIMNSTGVLNLDGAGAIQDIVYKGMINDENEPTDVLVDYICYLIEGDYIKEE